MLSKDILKSGNQPYVGYPAKMSASSEHLGMIFTVPVPWEWLLLSSSGMAVEIFVPVTLSMGSLYLCPLDRVSPNI